MTSTTHPRWWRSPIPILRLTQTLLVLSTLAIAIPAYTIYLRAINYDTFGSDSAEFPYYFFTFAWTALFLPMQIFWFPTLKDKPASLGLLIALDAFNVLWWMVGFALFSAAAADPTGFWSRSLRFNFANRSTASVVIQEGWRRDVDALLIVLAVLSGVELGVFGCTLGLGCREMHRLRNPRPALPMAVAVAVGGGDDVEEGDPPPYTKR